MCGSRSAAGGPGACRPPAPFSEVEDLHRRAFLSDATRLSLGLAAARLGLPGTEGNGAASGAPEPASGEPPRFASGDPSGPTSGNASGPASGDPSGPASGDPTGPASGGGLEAEPRETGEITLFLCGDVMTGRGIDQVLPSPVDPVLHEPYVKSARTYVRLAEEENGPIPAPVTFPYVWGDALDELRRAAPDARIVNLETSITTSDDAWAGKGIHYRMHPGNVPCLAAAGIDCCVLANNHVLDWGYRGLAETLEVLGAGGLETAGAGEDLERASSPAALPAGGRRILVFAFGTESSGIPPSWAAAPGRAGVSFLPEPSDPAAREVAGRVRRVRREGDVVVASLHWGGNWGYRIPPEQRRFAHLLIDEAGVDVVHGHSSHHPKGIEVYRDRPILYGCGDFLNDYEGIGGARSAELRDDLVLMYFSTLAPSGALSRLEMTPMRIRRFRLERASAEAVAWLRDVLARESGPLGSRVELREDGRLELRWGAAS